MTRREEIMAMQPGAEIDLLVVSALSRENDVVGLQPYSSDDAAAIRALEYGREKGLWRGWSMHSPRRPWPNMLAWVVCIHRDGSTGVGVFGEAPTCALAAGRAMLLAREGRKEDEHATQAV